MSLSEFQLISKYFREKSVSHENTVLGIGDDAAIVRVPAGHKLVTSVTQHSFKSSLSFIEDAEKKGHEILIRALNDFSYLYPDHRAIWMTLSLSLAHLNEDWLMAFSQGLFSCASKNNIQLIGGDTSKGSNIIRINLSGLKKQSS